jgi:hypothetical protein
MKRKGVLSNAPAPNQLRDANPWPNFRSQGESVFPPGTFVSPSLNRRDGNQGAKRPRK